MGPDSFTPACVIFVLVKLNSLRFLNCASSFTPASVIGTMESSSVRFVGGLMGRENQVHHSCRRKTSACSGRCTKLSPSFFEVLVGGRAVNGVDPVSEWPMGVSDRGLLDFVARLSPPSSADSDGELLDRFVKTADDDAFAGLVRRHGPMVLSVCRRRLGRDAENEDAFQAVFLTLANSARSLSREGSLAGWLYRVAYLIASKSASRRSRRRAEGGLTVDVASPNSRTSTCESEELKSIIDAELAGLPDKFRSVVVLCLVEGQTNVEAATVLGVPVGTIDSRLNSARKKLRHGLSRRGVALGLGVTLEQVVGGSLGAAECPAFRELAVSTVRVVLTEIAGPGAISPAVANLARGVGTMMTPTFRLAVILGVTLGILGGAGAGIYFATAADPAKLIAKSTEKIAPEVPLPPALAATVGLPSANPAISEVKLAAASGLTHDQLLGLLHEKADAFDDTNLTDCPLIELLHMMSKRHNVTFVILEEAFKAEQVNDIKEMKPNLATTQTKGMTPHQMLTMILGSMNATYLVKNGRLEIVPIKFAAKVCKAALTQHEEGRETLTDPLITVNIKEKSLKEAVSLIAERYDLTVVISPQAGENRPGFVTASLQNVPADQALEVFAELCDLQVVRRGNVFLITSRDHANKMLKEQLEKARHEFELKKLREVQPKTPESP